MSKNSLAKTAKQRAVAQATSRAGVAIGPVAALAGELGASALLWSFATPESLPWMTPAVALSTAGISTLVWQVGRDRSTVGRVMSVGTTVMTGAHLIASSVMGPFTSPLIGIWGWLGSTTAVAWIVRLWIARDNAQVEGAKQQVSLWDRAAQKVGGALEGSSFKPKEITADRMSGPLQLEAGETVTDAQSSRDRLASVLGLPPGGVRITADPDNASKGELTLVRRDMLRVATPYVGPSAVGGSAALPVRVGMYEHGGEAWLHQHRPGWGEVHLILMGMTGAGKTYAAYILLGEDFTRTDQFTIYVDVVKGAQSLGPIARGLKWVIRTEAEARALIKAIKDRVIPTRANYLGRRKLKAWAPGCGIPRLVIHVEEGSGLFLGNQDFVRVMERARSVGVQIRLSMQRPSYTTVDVAARAQFPAVWCFGVAEDRDAAFAMPKTVLEAGADPAKWQANQPGSSYLIDPVVDEKDYVVPLRTLDIADEQLELLAEYAHKHGADLDDLTAEAFGDLYTSRVPVEKMLAEDGVVEQVSSDDDDVFGDEDQPKPWEPSEEDPAPDLQPDIDSPMEPPTGSTLRFGTRGEATPEEAAAQFETRLLALQQEGREEVRAADLTEVARSTGRSPAWIYKQLHRRVDSGHLVRTDTGFRFARALTPA